MWCNSFYCNLECAKLHTSRVFVPYMSDVPNVHYVPTYFTCSRAFLVLLVCVPSCLCFVRAVRLLFFTCLTCLTCLHSLRALRALFFLRAYILLMYMLIKLTQINENLSTFIKNFHLYKTRDKFCITFSCSKQKILITFNVEENTGLLKDWNIIWNEKFREC